MTFESPKVLPKQWNDFLHDVDAQLTQPIEIHCLGGFVLHVLFQLPRPTADIDFIAAIPIQGTHELMNIAGLGTALSHKHRLYLQFVTICEFPDDFEDRLIDLAPGQFSHLRLRALAPEDLVLSKLTRNSPKDIYDVRYLATKGAIDPVILKKRYTENMRPYLVNTDRHDLTLELWMEEIQEAIASNNPTT
jgi:hypothetical protein